MDDQSQLCVQHPPLSPVPRWVQFHPQTESIVRDILEAGLLQSHTIRRVTIMLAFSLWVASRNSPKKRRTASHLAKDRHLANHHRNYSHTVIVLHPGGTAGTPPTENSSCFLEGSK
jgi:hypothetical protein